MMIEKMAYPVSNPAFPSPAYSSAPTDHPMKIPAKLPMVGGAYDAYTGSWRSLISSAKSPQVMAS
mgnify:CR=1 FL=1